MSENPCIYIVGTAGAGKTTLTRAFHVWMQTQGHDLVTVNLDPGATGLPYAPDVDIRDWIRLEDVMEEYGLGPNGAQVAAADMIAMKIEEVRKVLDTFRTNYVVVDTPGQIELFAFRQSSDHIIRAMSDQALLVFCFDPYLSKTPSGFIAELLLSATTQFRLGIPTINVLTKTDLLEESVVEEIVKWSGEHQSLYMAALDEHPTAATQANLEIFRALENVGAFRAVVPVSAVEMSGLQDIYSAAQQLWMGGEDLEPA